MKSVATLPRWRVVASIRKFDLRYSHEIRDLFLGTPSTSFIDPEFRAIRHCLVPVLSEGELSQIEAQSPNLFSLLGAVPPGRAVLFNVRILAESLNSGVAASDLTPINNAAGTARPLLVLIVSSTLMGGATCEGLLRHVTDAMVRGRVLQADRADLTATGTDLNDLLSRHGCLSNGSGTFWDRQTDKCWLSPIMFSFATTQWRISSFAGPFVGSRNDWPAILSWFLSFDRVLSFTSTTFGPAAPQGEVPFGILWFRFFHSQTCRRLANSLVRPWLLNSPHRSTIYSPYSGIWPVVTRIIPLLRPRRCGT